MTVPDSARRALIRRLRIHCDANWVELEHLEVRFRASFAYVGGRVAGREAMPLCRLRWVGSQDRWGFAIWLWSKEGYEDSVLPSGEVTGPPEDALDCACGLYLAGT